MQKLLKRDLLIEKYNENMYIMYCMFGMIMTLSTTSMKKLPFFFVFTF